MADIFDMAPLTDTSPRFSKELASPLSAFATFTAIPSVQRETVVGSTGGSASKIFLGASPVGEAIASELFSATAQAKIWTSKVAMLLDIKTRDRLFRQLDSLHDADEWVAGDKPVNLESYQTCVRAILYHHIDSKPALALMPSGNILALWKDGADKLTVEFLPKNQTRWMIQNSASTGIERATGISPLERLREVIEPYCANRWFSAR